MFKPGNIPIIASPLQIRQQMPREVKELAQSHIASRQQRWDFNIRLYYSCSYLHINKWAHSGCHSQAVASRGTTEFFRLDSGAEADNEWMGLCTAV